MSYYVYMLKSLQKKSVTYVGYSKSLQKRIALHNSGKGAKFTRGRKWKLIYKEKMNSKSKAIYLTFYFFHTSIHAHDKLSVRIFCKD